MSKRKGRKMRPRKMWAYVENGCMPNSPHSTKREVYELMDSWESEAIGEGRAHVARVLVTEIDR